MGEEANTRDVKGSEVRQERLGPRVRTKPTHDELAKHYTQHLWSIVNRTNTSLLAWATAMLLFLVGSLIPLASKVSALNEIKYELRVSSEQLVAKINDMRNLATATTRNESKEKEAQEAVAKLKLIINEQRAKVDRKTKTRDVLKNELTNLSTPLGPVPIPTFYSPLVWACLFAGLLLFFLYRRSIVLATIAQIIQINIQQRRRSVEEIQRLGWGAPFWLAPLPATVQVGGDKISREQLTSFLGWRSRDRLRPLLTLGFIAVGLLVYLWVLKLTFDISQNYNDPHAALRVRISVLIILLFCFLICVFWLRPTVEAGEFGSTMPYSRQRRIFLAMSSMTIAAASVYVLFPRKYLPRWLTARAHRFKIPERDQAAALDASFRNSFRLHKKSGVLHYVDANGWTAHRVPLSPGNLELKSPDEAIGVHLASTTTTPAPNSNAIITPAVAVQAVNVSATMPDVSNSEISPVPQSAPPSPSPAGPPAVTEKPTPQVEEPSSQVDRPNGARLYRAQLAATTECLALDQLHKNNVDTALKVLWAAIQVDTDLKSGTRRKPNYRLYDLLAGLSHRHSGLFDRSQLDKLIQEHWPDDEQLKKRTKQWHAPSQRWRGRWEAKDLQWKHPFGTSSAYRGYPTLGQQSKGT